MNTFDIAIIAVGIFGLVIWIRGGRRRSISDCVLGLVLGVVASALYFFLFSLTRTAWPRIPAGMPAPTISHDKTPMNMVLDLLKPVGFTDISRCVERSDTTGLRTLNDSPRIPEGCQR